MIKIFAFTAREDNVQYPLLQELPSHSQLGMSEWAGVMQVWTWTYYTAETNTLDGPENTPKYAFRDPKMIFSGRGALQNPPIVGRGEGDTLSAYPTPIYSRLRRLYP